jgi:hypothetical protein
MSQTTFEIDLDGTELPVSSFSYRSDESGESGSVTLQGVEAQSIITNNPTGTLTINKIVDSSSTEILTSGIDVANVSNGPTRKSAILPLADVVLSGSIPAKFEVDDLTEFEQMQGGFWSFRLSEITQGYQRGMTVDYLSVERYISSVAVEYNGDTFGTVTLTESETPPDDETVAGDPGMPGCTTLLTVGLPSSTAFDTYCSSGYGPLYEYYTSPEGYYYDMYVFKYRQFTLPAETTVRIEFRTTLGTGLHFDSGIASGFEFDLIQGEYTPFTNPAPTIFTYRGNGEFNGTLPAGTYTCRMTMYLDRPDDSIAWASSPYYLYVYEP